MWEHMCVFYSRSVYVSTSWRETRGYYLMTPLMNCHRTERSGVYSLCVCLCSPVCVCVCVCVHVCVYIKQHAADEGEMKGWNRDGCFLRMKSRCHLNQYEPLGPKSHHQHRDRSVTGRDLIIKTHKDRLPFSLILSFLPPLTFFSHPPSLVALSLNPFLLHIPLCQTLSLSYHLLFHLPTSLHQSVVALFFLSACSLPEEPWSTKPAVFRSFSSSPTSFPPRCSLFSLTFNPSPRGSVAGLIAEVTVPGVPQWDTAILSSHKCYLKLYNPVCYCDCCPCRLRQKPTLHYRWNCLFVRQEPFFPTPHCHTSGESHTSVLMQTWTRKDSSTHILAHAFVRAPCRLEVVEILKELQGTLLLFSLQFTCLYKPVIKTLAHTHTHTHSHTNKHKHPHTHSMNPSERQKATLFELIPAHFLIHTSPLTGPWRTHTHKCTNKFSQDSLYDRLSSKLFVVYKITDAS